MKLRKSFILMITFIFTFSSFIACSNKQDDIKTVKIAYFPNITHAQALIGKEQQQFEKALGDNVKVEWVKFNSGTSEIEALFAGEIDIGYIGPSPAINGFVKSNGDLKIISGSADAGATLVCRSDADIKSVKDFSGRKVSVPSICNTQDQMLRGLLKKDGLKDTTEGGTVEIVPCNNSDVRTLFDKGEIDCAFVPEPWGSSLIKECGAKIVLDYDEIMDNGNYPTTVLISTEKYINENKDIVDKVLDIHINITDFINNNKEEAKEIVNKQLEELTQGSLSKEVLDSSFDKINFTVNPEESSVKKLMKLSEDLGIIDNVENSNSIFYLDILNSKSSENTIN